jgi:hypothetical protein
MKAGIALYSPSELNNAKKNINCLSIKIKTVLQIKDGLLKKPFHRIGYERYGGDNRFRTSDLLLVEQALSQLSYAPKPIRLKCIVP